MIVKGLALTALVASTPLALFATQEPKAQEPAPAATRKADLQRASADLQRARAELAAARRDLARLRAQLDAALDRLDETFEPQRERNCSPSRGRALMSHYQWLRGEGHADRAEGALAKIVDQVGDDHGRLNSVAWDLMTDKATAGRFDEVALAMSKRMLRQGARMAHNHLDTAALAHFLNGEVERAIALQQQAIAKGGRGDDYRRRLRTYEAAMAAVAEARGRAGAASPPATMVASKDEE